MEVPPEVYEPENQAVEDQVEDQAADQESGRSREVAEQEVSQVEIAVEVQSKKYHRIKNPSPEVQAVFYEPEDQVADQIKQ